MLLFMDVLAALGLICYLYIAYIIGSAIGPKGKEDKGGKNGFLMWWLSVLVVAALMFSLFSMWHTSEKKRIKEFNENYSTTQAETSK